MVINMSEEINSETANGGLDDINQTNNEIALRRKKLADLKTTGENPYEIVRYDKDADAAVIKAHFEDYEQHNVSIAGRMMSRRDMGKANFIDIADGSGRIQCYVRIDDVGEEAFAEFKKWDIGDIIGLKGFVFKTKRGEISVHAKEIELLSKWHLSPYFQLPFSRPP
jgi:lysyl-tRNA synthetase class 2